MTRLTFACNGASARGKRNVVRLDYQGPGPNRVRVGLPRFVTNLLHLPEKYLDLLEIAAYVYAADRLATRGRIDAVEYAAWARLMDFRIRVRQEGFWNTGDRGTLLKDALNWMTGDAEYRFVFAAGHSTSPANLFDANQVLMPQPEKQPAVVPFSGGLDSLAGVLMLLEESDQHVILVSHQANPRTKRTQDQLARSLRELYPGRVTHYPFECTLSGDRGREETQRSRSFLYTAISATIALVHGTPRIYVFENGVTSLNLARRQDLMNARASRTTHPQTLGRLARFFSAFSEQNFEIEAPFAWMTKAEIVRMVARYRHELLSSAVSCSATFKHLGQGTHCGECFQCLDRRLAAFSVDCDHLDHPGLYSVDVTTEPFSDRVGEATAVDYLRQAAFLRTCDAADFERKHLKDLADLLEWIPGSRGDLDTVERVHELLRRHGSQVHRALVQIRDRVDDPFAKIPEGTLLKIMAERQYLRPEVERLADRIEGILRDSLPRMFRTGRPKDEQDLNNKIAGVLVSHYQELRSEYPVTRFACSGVIPDHQVYDLLIEAKYVRKGTAPSKASEGISADLTKFPQSAYVLFVVLDLDNAVVDDAEFARAFQTIRPCRVVIIH